MSKLLEDPKVAALVDKSVTKAKKEAAKAAADVVQNLLDNLKADGEVPSGKVAYASTLRDLKSGIKAVGTADLSNPPASK